PYIYSSFLKFWCPLRILWAVIRAMYSARAQPMSLSADLRTAFWIIPLVLQPLIALSIICRRQTGRLAMFLIYTLFVCGRDFVLLLLRSHKTIYVWIYWVGEPMTVLLGLAAICQVLWQLIK